MDRDFAKVWKYRLHPLIHSFPFWNSAQDIEKKKAELMTPHFLSLNQDIVGGPPMQKCGLKYDMYCMWEYLEWLFRQYSQHEEKNECKVKKDYAE